MLILLLFTCSVPDKPVVPTEVKDGVFLVVLGTVQDAGSPHIACRKDCCQDLFAKPDPLRQVTALGLIDTRSGKQYLLEASPDLPRQAKTLRDLAGKDQELPDGIFLTHAHVGHYTGLMYLGKEATNAKSVPVYAMPKMDDFLRANGPWSQLVDNENIALRSLRADSTLVLSDQLRITPFTVPHRDEFSETVGYRIDGPFRSALFIPDIDKWERWERSIEEEIAKVDYAFLDGTFFNGAELNTRDISQVPHPFIEESLRRFSALPDQEKEKIHFIHFNHTNDLLIEGSSAQQAVAAAGMHVARYGDRISLE